MRIAFDLDGVLYDFGNSVRRYLDSIGKEYGFKDGKPEPHCWDFYKYWHLTTAEFVQVCHDGVDAGYIFGGAARPNAVKAVKKVKALGHEVIIITDRQFGSKPENSHKATQDWLLDHDIPYDELYFSADKTCVSVDMFVEDKWENFVALTNVGTDCYLINRDWNIDNDLFHPKRISDVSDYANIVEQATKDGFVDLAF